MFHKLQGILFCVVALLLMVPVALADRARVEDADDSPGSLDIRFVGHRHENRLLVHRIRTYEDWDMTVLQEGSYFYVMFHTDGDKKPDRLIFVAPAPDGTPFAQMKNPKNNRIVGYAKVWHPTDQVLQLEFPRRMLGKDVTKYRWKAESVFHQEGHPECGTSGDAISQCPDHAPQRGTVGHKLG